MAAVSAAVAYFLTVHEGGEKIRIGEPAPSFTLPSKTAPVSLNQFRGKVVLLNFWATWCPPCLQEMPSLEKLNQKMKGKEFELLAVNVDEEGWLAIERFLRKIPVTFTIVIDPRGDVATEYGTQRLPESFLIDKNGVVVQKYLGPRDWTDEKIISEINRH